GYTHYEIVSYANVKSIYPTEGGLTFQTDGKKLFILMEPPNYHLKNMEPFLRPSAESIPQRFVELDCLTTRNQTKAFWSKQAMISYGSFTIMRPQGLDFSFVFFALPDIYDSISLFCEKTFNKEAGLPQSDAKKIAAAVAACVKESMPWKVVAEE
ncbi:MAG: hypothetical protein Q8M76_03045, partial [Spirochaetaceae bacterium]|nr:hypothetical protein [Spirochaetaceae bacterium]